MIIQIRGTSGSGKSTAMRRTMDMFGNWESIKVAGRKQPLYYRNTELPGLLVLGHYESPCGGCDTIGSAKEVFDTLENLSLEPLAPLVILCEGLLLSEDVKWSVQMPELRVLFLTTPLDTCLAQIKQRRAAAGNEKPLNPSNTANRVTVIERARVKLTNAKVPCYRCSASQAPSIIRKWVLDFAQREDVQWIKSKVG